MAKSRFNFTPRKFWRIFLATEALLALDFITTWAILHKLNGVELNSIVVFLGQPTIATYKLAAGVFIAGCCWKAKDLRVMVGLMVVFICVVAWNFANILYAVV